MAALNSLSQYCCDLLLSASCYVNEDAFLMHRETAVARVWVDFTIGLLASNRGGRRTSYKVPQRRRTRRQLWKITSKRNGASDVADCIASPGRISIGSG